MHGLLRNICDYPIPIPVILKHGGDFMRLVARFSESRQASALVDSLRNIGLDRKDMIISDMAKEQKYSTIEEAAEEITFVKTEREGFGDIRTFASGVKGLKGDTGIIVAVEAPKREGTKIREIMEQSGAVEIAQD